MVCPGFGLDKSLVESKYRGPHSRDFDSHDDRPGRRCGRTNVLEQLETGPGSTVGACSVVGQRGLGRFIVSVIGLKSH